MEDFNVDQDVNQNENQDQGFTFKVGGREYDADAAKVKIENADNFIETLKQEKADQAALLQELQAKLDKATKVEEALAKLQSNQDQDNTQSEPKTPVYSEEKLEEVASKKLQELLEKQQSESTRKQREAIAIDTFNETKAKLAEVYGDKLQDTMAAKAEELGCSVEDLVQMAKDPVQSKFLLNSMKATAPVSENTPSNSFNTPAFNREAPDKMVESWKGATSTTIMDALEKKGARFKRDEHLTYTH